MNNVSVFYDDDSPLHQQHSLPPTHSFIRSPIATVEWRDEEDKWNMIYWSPGKVYLIHFHAILLFLSLIRNHHTQNSYKNVKEEEEVKPPATREVSERVNQSATRCIAKTKDHKVSQSFTLRSTNFRPLGPSLIATACLKRCSSVTTAISVKLIAN